MNEIILNNELMIIFFTIFNLKKSSNFSDYRFQAKFLQIVSTNKLILQFADISGNLIVYWKVKSMKLEKTVLRGFHRTL